MTPTIDAPAASVRSASRLRVAGICYLVVIAGGLFASGVREQLIVDDDAAATARRIAADEQLWRWAIAVHLLYLVAAVAVGVILYGLLRPVQETLARLAVAFTLIDVTIEAVSLLHLMVPVSWRTRAPSTRWREPSTRG